MVSLLVRLLAAAQRVVALLAFLFLLLWAFKWLIVTALLQCIYQHDHRNMCNCSFLNTTKNVRDMVIYCLIRLQGVPKLVAIWVRQKCKKKNQRRPCTFEQWILRMTVQKCPLVVENKPQRDTCICCCYCWCLLTLGRHLLNKKHVESVVKAWGLSG